MSNTEQDCRIARGNDAVELLISPREKDLGGFTVRRSLPNAARKMIGPWIFFDHMGPAQFAAGSGVNVRPHPHINLATVTYLFAGEILHRDSLGSNQAIRPGDINLMVAGRGIVHSERPNPEVIATPHCVHALQLWLALPEPDEEVDPAFFHYPAAEIPTVTVGGVKVRIMMGAAFGMRSPVKVFADTLYVEAYLERGQTLTLPQADERGVYVVSGKLRVGETDVPAHSMAVVRRGSGVTVEAVEASQVAIIGGESVGKRYIDWNFVSTRKERIEQAKADWKARRFPVVPGDEIEFIPLPG